MNMIKKAFISSLIFAFLCLGAALNSVFAEEDRDAKIAENINILAAIGLIDSPRTGYEAEEYMTRQEFAGILGKMFGLTNYAEGMMFDDVPPGISNAGYIYSAALKGIFLGDGAGSFRPYDNITYVEAVKSILFAAGYKNYINASAGGNSILCAGQTGLSNGVKCTSEMPVTRGEMSYLFVNALELPVIYVTGYEDYDGENGRDILGKDDDITVLTKYLKLKKVDGVVTANEYTSSDNGIDTKCSKNQLMINGEIYEYSGGSDFLGMTVYAYVTDDDDSEALYISSFDESDTVYMMYCDFYYQDGNIVYSPENGREKKYRVQSGASVIYNDKFIGHTGTSYITEKDFELKSGGILMIDNDLDGIYDVLRLTEYESIYVAEFDGEYKNVVDANSGVRTAFSDKSAVYEYYYEGYSAEFENISKNCLLSIAKSRDDKLYRIYISDSPVYGSVTAMYDDKAVIGNKEYRISNYYKNLIASDNVRVKAFGAGDGGKFLLTADCEIAAFINVSSINYAYIISMWSEDDTEEEYYIRAYTTNGLIEEYKLADKVNVTESGLTVRIDKKNVFSKLKSYEVIRFELNESNEIRSFETSVYSEYGISNVFTKNMEKRSLQYHAGTLGAAFSIDTATIVFNVPDPEQNNEDALRDADSYSMSNSFSASLRYTVDIYDMDEFRTVGLVVNYLDSGGIILGKGYTQPLIVSDKYMEVIDDEPMTVIKGLESKVESEVYINNLDMEDDNSNWHIEGFTPNQLEFGDIVQYNTKGNNILNRYRVLFRPNVQKDPVEEWTNTIDVPAYEYRQELYTAFGEIRSVNENQFVYELDGGKQKVAKFTKSPVIYVVDMKEKTVKAGDKNDVHTGDDVFLMINYQELYITVVYHWED